MGFRVWGLGVKFQWGLGLGVRVWGLGFGNRLHSFCEGLRVVVVGP